MLVARDRELRQWLGPAGEDAVRPHIASLLMALKHETEDEEAREIKQRIFAVDLADLPLFAVEQACKDFRQGRAGDGKWMPTQAEVRTVALRHADKARKEQADVRLVLGADVFEPIRALESRAHAIEQWSRIRADIVANADPFAKPTCKPLSQLRPADAEAALKRALDNPLPSPVLSDALRAVLAKPRGSL